MSFGPVQPVIQQEMNPKKEEISLPNMNNIERKTQQLANSTTTSMNQKVMLNKIFELLNSSNDMSSNELGASFSRDLSFIDRKKGASPAFHSDFSPHEGSANLNSKSARSWGQIGKSFSITGRISGLLALAHKLFSEYIYIDREPTPRTEEQRSKGGPTPRRLNQVGLSNYDYSS